MVGTIVHVVSCQPLKRSLQLKVLMVVIGTLLPQIKLRGYIAKEVYEQMMPHPGTKLTCPLHVAVLSLRQPVYEIIGMIGAINISSTCVDPCSIEQEVHEVINIHVPIVYQKCQSGHVIRLTKTSTYCGLDRSL